MKKKNLMSIEIELQEKGVAKEVVVDRNTGHITLLDNNGNEVKPKSTKRSVYYDRSKGKKHQTVIHNEGGSISIGGLKELSRLQSFFVIDTNTKLINKKRVSASFFTRWKLSPEGLNYRLSSIRKYAYLYEFYDIPEKENSEMFAILKICNDVLQHERPDMISSIGFVTDSDMDVHSNISSQTQPIYKNHFLPQQFHLIYASAETGQETLNRLMSFCDKHSSKHLNGLIDGTISTEMEKLQPAQEDAEVLWEFRKFPIIKFESSAMSGMKLQKDSSYTIQSKINQD